MTQKYQKFDSKSFKDYKAARALADATVKNIGKSDDMRVRVRLRQGGVFDVVTYKKLPPPKAEKNVSKST